ncbi:MAG: dinitrogenase iron-molybdenum cofactor biosynthesis protein [Erysipelotrichaceae bacterium]|nr:dinitrogenase iron-molybdenum cofactor biosynthesis protein [Erysipelotrichaceae bacterium]
MKIAVTYEKGMVFQHFGKSEQFLVVEVEQTKLLNKSLLSADGQGHSALVTLLAKAEIDTLICGGLGQGARNALEQAGITVISGAFGNAEAAVDAYLNGSLQDSPSGQCSHHGDHHACTDHSCS